MDLLHQRWSLAKGVRSVQLFNVKGFTALIEVDFSWRAFAFASQTLGAGAGHPCRANQPLSAVMVRNTSAKKSSS